MEMLLIVVRITEANYILGYIFQTINDGISLTTHHSSSIEFEIDVRTE